MRLISVFDFVFSALRGHGVRTFLSLIGVSIGVFSVILLTGIGEGAKGYVVGELNAMGSNLLMVVPGKVETKGAFPGVGGVTNALTLDDAQMLVKYITKIRRLAPVASGTEQIAHGSRSRDVSVIGTTHDFKIIKELELYSGTFLQEGEMDRGDRVCVIGGEVAKQLFPNGQAVGSAVRVGGWRLRVIGVMSQRGNSLGSNMDEMVIVPVNTCLKMFNKTSLFHILVQARNPAQLTQLKAEIIELIKERHNGEEDVTLVTQDAMRSAFNKAVVALTLMLTIIAGVSLSVAGLGIMNVMLVAVSERRAEVGLLKALGATTRQISYLFLAEAVIISLAGCLLGLILGFVSTSMGSYIFRMMDFTPPLWAVIMVLIVSFVVGCGSGVIPAIKAAKLDPVSSLRGAK